MGRMRIKKKESVIPFRDTIAYRLLLTTGSIILMVFTFYELAVGITTRNTTLMIVAAVAAAMSGLATYYNLGQVRNARIPERNLRRIKRR